MIRKYLLSLSILILNVGLIVGQLPQEPTAAPSKPLPQMQPPPEKVQDVVKITTNLVQVDAVVMKDGKQVTDLTADDFELFEDGKPQAITNFSYISNMAHGATAVPVAHAKSKEKIATPVAPAEISPGQARRTVAIMVDDLGMSFSSVSEVRHQLRKYIDEDLSPNDLIAIIRTGGDVGALQQFTNDKRVLTTAIDHIRWNPCSRVGVHVFNPEGAPPVHETAGYGLGYGPCGQPLVDSLEASLRIFDFVLDGMKYLPGRKSMVVLSDSLPISTQMAGDEDSDLNLEAVLHKVAEKAIRAAVVIYAADTRGLQYTGPTAADKVDIAGGRDTAALSRLSGARTMAMFNDRLGADLLTRKTGGFLNMNSNDFGLKKVMADQEGYYLIGFRPADDTFNRLHHALKLRVKKPGLTVRTRDGKPSAHFEHDVCIKRNKALILSDYSIIEKAEQANSNLNTSYYTGKVAAV